MKYTHEPVLLAECMEVLSPKPGKIIVDGTAGLGGHAEALLSAGARVICVDKDCQAQAYQKQRLQGFGAAVSFELDDFRNLSELLGRLGLKTVDGVLLDLGVSSLQLDKPERGFSYRTDAPLDMRMDPNAPLTADEIVNGWPKEELSQIFYKYGEERYSALIAAAIAANRPVKSTTQLCDIILGALPAKARRENRHPARRVFQAVRIAVNDELGAVEQGVSSALEHLAAGGVAAVITFHSLEDRIVKHLFAKAAAGCGCPPDFPVCVCGKQEEFKLMKRREPGLEELARNSRASSARLRAIKRTESKPELE